MEFMSYASLCCCVLFADCSICCADEKTNYNYYEISGGFAFLQDYY